jgi:hypothetical protein
MIKKVTKKPVAKKVVAKKVVKKALPKMQDGGVTRRRLKQAGISKDEYKTVMSDNSRMATLPAGRVSQATSDEKFVDLLKYNARKKSQPVTGPSYSDSVYARVSDAAMKAGVLPKQKNPGNIYNYTSNASKFVSDNPKILEFMSEDDIMRFKNVEAGAGRGASYKRGGKKTTPVMKKGGKVTKGMGFKVAQKQIAKKQGLSMERAGAILAAGARKASPAAKRKNPNLKKVKG